MRYSGSLQSNRRRRGDFYLKARQRKIILAASAAALLILILILALCGRRRYTQPDEIVLDRVTASSTESDRFKPQFIADGNPATAWSPSRQASGSGQYSWIKIYLKEPAKVSGIRLINGISDEEKSSYEKYNRAKSVRVVLSDYASYFWVLQDREKNFQTLSFPTPRETSSVQLFIHSVYRGTHWDQLCLGEIIIY